MDKEKLIDMFSMRVNGSTYEEIGNKYNVSKQNVNEMLRRIVNPKGAKWNYLEYPVVAKYMKDNKLTLVALAEKAGIKSQSLRLFLTGKVKSLKTIDALIKATGLTYEQIMNIENPRNGLTLDELSNMVGKRVWREIRTPSDEKWGFWTMIERIDGDSVFHSCGISVFDNGLFYKNPPGGSDAT